MADAPTTEEVRAGLAQAEREDRAAARAYSGGPDRAAGYEMALAISEHRDRLAAEVARLQERCADLAAVAEAVSRERDAARRAGAEAFQARVVGMLRDEDVFAVVEAFDLADEIERMSVEEGGEGG